SLNLDTLQSLAENHNLNAIDIDTLIAHGLVSKCDLVKVLGRGELKAKLIVKVHYFSQYAIKAIEAAGGTAEKIEWMQGFITTIRNIFKIEELRTRIITTLSLILIYRLGSYIVLPGVDSTRLESGAGDGGTIIDILSNFTGGAFTRASVFALGIMPYISASII